MPPSAPMDGIVSIIERLGGRSALSGEFPELSEKAVFMWERRGGIPGKWHLPLMRLAREQGVELSEDELLSTTSRGRAA